MSCLVLLVISCGIGYGLSVMYAELVVVFDAKRADAAWVQSLYSGLSCAIGSYMIHIYVDIFCNTCIFLSGLTMFLIK